MKYTKVYVEMNCNIKPDGYMRPPWYKYRYTPPPAPLTVLLLLIFELLLMLIEP